MGVDRTCLGYGRFEPDYTLSNCMMTFVEVEVDTETGKVTLLRVVNATDVGQIIDPHGLEGQLNGCLGSAGIDSALFEEMILDRTTGHMLNANLIDYKWRTFSRAPGHRQCGPGNTLCQPPLPRCRGGGDSDITRPFRCAHGRFECTGHLAPRVSGDTGEGA